MHLLNYTKNLYHKINYYDKYIKDNNLKSQLYNPFIDTEKYDVTIIWVQDVDKKL